MEANNTCASLVCCYLQQYCVAYCAVLESSQELEKLVEVINKKHVPNSKAFAISKRLDGLQKACNLQRNHIDTCKKILKLRKHLVHDFF